MKFYDCKTAPSPRRVRIFAAEKDMPLDTVQVDLASGEQFSDEFRAINPDCVVPVLETDDGVVITEVLAICEYLEALQPDPSLFGASATERALVTMWNTKAEQQGLMACAEALRNAVPGLKGRAVPGPDDFEQIPALAARGRDRLGVFFEKLDRRLGECEFLAGDAYSIADITALVATDFAQRLKVEKPQDAENLNRWHAAVSARPSAGA